MLHFLPIFQTRSGGDDQPQRRERKKLEIDKNIFIGFKRGADETEAISIVSNNNT